jgi:RNA polymerase sigma factor (TIGR02999 family)
VNAQEIFCATISTYVANQDQHDITGMLAAWNCGDTDALDRLVDLVYPELRRIARQYLERRRPGGSLESAALANEAYLKLVRAGGIRCENRVHFLALCSQIIRRILVDHVRRRGFAKRGGDAFHRFRCELREPPADTVDRCQSRRAIHSKDVTTLAR